MVQILRPLSIRPCDVDTQRIHAVSEAWHAMRLRRPCEHGRYESHYRDDPEDEYGGTLCPGGEFLAAGSIVIEKVEGDWPPTGISVELDRPVNVLGDRELRTLLDALAVREGER